MARLILAASLGWPLLLAAALAGRTADPAALAPAAVYAAAGRICHQRPERSFRTAGVQWPVCGRCAGLYLSAPAGAWLAWRRRASSLMRVLPLLAAVALPTAVTVALEWLTPIPIDSVTRAAAALPLGAGLAFVLVRAADGRIGAIG
jgi:uncharacterized membrane protein